MKYRILGKTAFRVSEISFGAWAIGGAMSVQGMPVGWSNVNDADSEAAIYRALDLGINFFDTADMYGAGHSESMLGRCLEKRNDCIIATKAGNRITEKNAYKDFSSAYIRESIEGSLRRLRRDVIDLFQLHNPSMEIIENGEIFDTLEQLKKEGKIKAAGVSISNPAEGIALIRQKKVDCLQVLFNILNQEPAKELFPMADEENIGIIVRVPLASGLLTGKFNRETRFFSNDSRSNYLTPRRLNEVLDKIDLLKSICESSPYTLTQIALAFILKFDAVSCAIPGAKNPEQVDQNVSAADVELSQKIFQEIKKEFAGYNFYLRHNVKV